MSNLQEVGLPAYRDLYPKSKSKWHLSQKVAWSLIIGLLTLSITLGFYIIYDQVEKANEEPIEKLIVEEKAKFLDEIIHEFPSMRKKLIDFAVMRNEYQWVKTLVWSFARHFHSKYRTKNENKRPPLHVATQNDNPEIVQTLLEFGYDVNEEYVESSWYQINRTAIFEASSIPNSKVLELPIQNGANVNQRDASTYTPLHMAALKNCPKNVEILIQNGAEINAMSEHSSGQTPLLFALWTRNVELIKLLLENGADPTIPENPPEASTLEYARSYPYEPDFIALLEKYSGD